MTGDPRNTVYDPRKAVVERLAESYDHWAEVEQEEVGAGRYTSGEGAHAYALFVLRAYEAEDRRGPEPAERPCSLCHGPCKAYTAVRR